MEKNKCSVDIDKLVSLLMGLKEIEWRKIAYAVDEKFSEYTTQVTLNNAEDLKEAIERELSDPDSGTLLRRF